ncbi:MAG: hypothetical protein IJB59_04005 [Oscillospiraceae bacterium]|nr:hypothetical protein [Oscillospiraceae bacterium]
MGRKVLGVLTAVLLAANLSLQADAAEAGGRIRISLDTGELPVTNGAVTLYQVGLPGAEGYQITEDFGGGMVRQEDAESVHLAQWLAESAGDLGRTVFLDVEGDVSFSNLEAGLYLAVQTQRTDGFYPFRPFLIAIPTAGSWTVEAQPKIEPIVLENPKTGQSFLPLLGAMGMVISGVGLYVCIDTKRKK